MLVIRSSQLHALAVEDPAGVLARLHAELAEDYPDELASMGPDGARAFVQRGIAVGIEHGLDTEDALARLLALMIQVGEQLERSPDRERAWARLRHAALPSELKIELVEQVVWERTGGRVVVPFEV